MADNEQLSYGDHKRRLFLTISISLPTLALILALVFRSVFGEPWIAVFLFFPPAIEGFLALVFLNQIRRRSRYYLFTALVLSLYTAFIIAPPDLKLPLQTLVLICCFNTVWFGLFQLGLDLASPIRYSEFYCLLAFLLISFLESEVSSAWGWAYALPFSLLAGTVVMKLCFADVGAGDDRSWIVLTACVEIVRVWLFRLGRDLVASVRFPEFCGIFVFVFGSHLVDEEFGVWSWPCALPVFLVTGVALLRVWSNGAGEGAVAGDSMV